MIKFFFSIEAQQEAEVCKRRRDWAFSERDKIVLERESIRSLCDKLRKERDRAVSDLAEALRDSDDVKRQKNEASKELKELRYICKILYINAILCVKNIEIFVNNNKKNPRFSKLFFKIVFNFLRK